tara:strand:+ start:193 stop:1389 length:1197 start_codon:yes stop_codon:yes gene_type:complete
LPYSSKGIRVLTSFSVFWCLFLAAPAVWAEKPVLLVVPLGPEASQDIQKRYDAISQVGLTPASRSLRSGVDLPRATSPQKAARPDTIRIQLLKARQHYENLETEALKNALAEVLEQIHTLPNPFLYQELIGDYLLLRAESALIEQDNNEATKILSTYHKVMPKDAEINAAFYTPTLRRLFEQAKQGGAQTSGSLRVRFPTNALNNLRIAVDLKNQNASPSDIFEQPLSEGRHLLSLSAEGVVPKTRFVEISPEQVTEINWFPQAPDAASQREGWLSRRNAIAQLSANDIQEFKSFQPGVEVAFVDAQGTLWVGFENQAQFGPQPDANAWAQKLKSLARSAQEVTASEQVSSGWGPWPILGGIVLVAGLGALIYVLNQDPVVLPPEIIEQGRVTCCVGE